MNEQTKKQICLIRDELYNVLERNNTFLGAKIGKGSTNYPFPKDLQSYLNLSDPIPPRRWEDPAVIRSATSKISTIYFGKVGINTLSILTVIPFKEQCHVTITVMTLGENIRQIDAPPDCEQKEGSNNLRFHGDNEVLIHQGCSKHGGENQECELYTPQQTKITSFKIYTFDTFEDDDHREKFQTFTKTQVKNLTGFVLDTINNITRFEFYTPPGNITMLYKTIQTLKNYKAIILEGVPGTGKTYGISKIVEHWTSQTGRKVEGKASGNYAITMHPSTSYEDFVEGLRPNTDGKNEGKLFHTVEEPTQSKDDNPAESKGFSYQNGFFKRICKEAAQAENRDRDYLVLLDEFNRCNIPKVMGDLLTTLESSKRVSVEDITDSELKEKHKYQTITLPYSKEIFFVPDNVYVIGTMNTTDRSVAPLDSALRRRFAFIRVWPMGFDPSNEQSLDAINKEIISLSLSLDAQKHMRHSIKLYHDINSVLKEHGQDVLIGHSYLYDLQRFLEDVENEADCLEITKMVWNQSIFPQLIDSLRKNNLVKLLDKDTKLSKKLMGLVDIKKNGKGLLNIPTLLLNELPQGLNNEDANDED